MAFVFCDPSLTTSTSHRKNSGQRANWNTRFRSRYLAHVTQLKSKVRSCQELSYEIEFLSITSDDVRHVQNLYSFLTDGICCGEECHEKCGLNLCDELYKKVG